MSQIQQQKALGGGAGWPKLKNDSITGQSMKLPVSQSLTLNRTINL